MLKIGKTGYLLMGFFLLLGLSFFYLGFITSPDALTDDNIPLKPLYYMMGIPSTVVVIGTLLYYKIRN